MFRRPPCKGQRVAVVGPHAHGERLHPAVDQPRGVRVDGLSPGLEQAADYLDDIVIGDDGAGNDV